MAAAVPYMLPVILTSRLDNERWALAAGVVGCILTEVGLLLHPEAHDIEYWKILVNRALAILAILSTAALVYVQVRSRRRLIELNQSLKESAEQLSAQSTELTYSNHALQKSNEELEQFAYVASHDLQEPLRTVTNYMELLRLRYSDSLDERAQRYVKTAVDATERMQRLISDLLSVSRAGRAELVVEELQLSELTDAVQLGLARLLEKSGGTIVVPNKLRFRGDRTQLTSALQNIVENSLKYRSEKSPEIVIRGTDQGDVWQIAVQDNGIGISDKHSSRVFQLFQRLRPKGEVSGNGIGLSLVKRFVENHKGDIWVSQHEPEGTVVTLTISKKVQSTEGRTYDVDMTVPAWSGKKT